MKLFQFDQRAIMLVSDIVIGNLKRFSWPSPGLGAFHSFRRLGPLAHYHGNHKMRTGPRSYVSLLAVFTKKVI